MNHPPGYDPRASHRRKFAWLMFAAIGQAPASMRGEVAAGTIRPKWCGSLPRPTQPTTPKDKPKC